MTETLPPIVSNPYEQMQQTMHSVVEDHAQRKITQEFPNRKHLLKEAKQAVANGEANRYGDALPENDKIIMSLSEMQKQALETIPEGKVALKKHLGRVAIRLGRAISAHRKEELDRIRGEANERFGDIEEFWGSEAETASTAPAAEVEPVETPPEPEDSPEPDPDDEVVDAEIVDDEPEAIVPEDEEVIDGEVLEDEEEVHETLETEVPPTHAPLTMQQLENLNVLASLSSEDLYGVIDEVRMFSRDLHADATVSGGRIDRTRGDDRRAAWAHFTHDQIGYIRARNIMQNALRVLGSKEGWNGAERDAIQQHYMNAEGTHHRADAPDTRRPTFNRQARPRLRFQNWRQREQLNPGEATARDYNERFADMQQWKERWITRHPGSDEVMADQAFQRALYSWQLVDQHEVDEQP